MSNTLLCRITLIGFALIITIEIAVAENIVINELMASNAHTLLDEDASSEDWIELYNTTDSPISLKGYKISNVLDPHSAWVFPDTIIRPGNYLLIFASEKDRITSGNGDVVATGQGIELWAKRDGFRFDYVALTGDCTAQIRIRKLDAENVFAKAGLIIRESLENNSRFVGTFSTISTRSVFMYSFRDTVNTRPKEKWFKSVLQNHPAGWLRLVRRGDTVWTYASEDGFFWKNDVQIAFHPQNETVYLGLSVASRSTDEFANCVYSDFEINESSVQPGELQSVQISAHGGDREGYHRELREFHTNFKLKRSGGAVYLWDNTGKLIDSARYDPQRVDVSWARQFDGAPNFLYNLRPTPSAMNNGGELGISAPPRFTIEGGFYDNTIEVGIERDQPSVSIYITTDGSEPTQESTLYDGRPIVVSSTGVIRARAFSDGYLPSAVATQYYIIAEQTDLPVVSIAVDPKELWDEEDGIFVELLSEREVGAHMQFWERERSSGFSADLGIRINGGGGSRTWPQRSLLCIARNLYGPTTFDFPLFPDRAPQSYKRLLLRNSGNDWIAAFMRDGVMARIAEPTGLDVQAYRPVASFLNGEYWGIYNLRERFDEHYFSEKYDIPKESIDLLENNVEIKEGSSEHYRRFLDSLLQPGISYAERMRIAERNVDIENLLTYYAVEMIAANRDWIFNNVKYWRSAAYDGRWRFVPFDMDATLHGFSSVSTDMFELVLEADKQRLEQPWPHNIFLTLFENDQFRKRFFNRYADMLNSVFLPERTLPLLNDAIDEISNEIERHKERWPDSMRDLDVEYAHMREFLERRPEFTRNQTVERFQLEGVANVTLAMNIPGAGVLTINSLHIAATPWSGIYFRGVPVEITAIPAPGFVFEKWDDSALPRTPKIVVPLSGDRLVTAIFRDTVNRCVVINEIMYNPPEDADCKDWVELHNASDRPFDLSEWSLVDDNDVRRYDFPQGVNIAPGEYLVVSEDPVAFSLVYPAMTNVIGGFSFGFNSNIGDEVRLFNQAGVLVDSVSYLSAYPWPIEANGLGSSLELIRPDWDNTAPENWVSSGTKGGTPGNLNETVVGSVEALQLTNSNSVAAFPNPCTNFVFLSCMHSWGRPLRALLYALTGTAGKPVTVYPDHDCSHVSAIILDVSGVAAGAYISVVQVFNGERWQNIGTTKLAVQR